MLQTLPATRYLAYSNLQQLAVVSQSLQFTPLTVRLTILLISTRFGV